MAIVNQFWSRYKDIKQTTIDAIVSGASFHDGFIEVNHKKGKPAPPTGACIPVAAFVNTNSDRQGKICQSPFEWLANYGEKGIKSCWTRALAGTSVCPICHKDELPYHVPMQCPLLAILNLKIVTCPPAAAAPPSLSPSPMPAPTPGGRSAAADAPLSPGSSGSLVPPSGLTAAVASAPLLNEEYDSGDDFHWAGDDFGNEYPPPKVTTTFSPYSPSCSHVSAVSFSSSITTSTSQPHPPRLSVALRRLLHSLSLSLVACPLQQGRLAVADTGATDHMVPDKSCFISYKFVSGLSVRMGNNSYVPVLGRGMAIFALNGKCILVRNVLHVPNLAVPLYSFCTHVTQRGCGFIGTKDSSYLVYFPTFVLSVDTEVDCHLSFESLGRSAPLATLHYVQPQCLPVIYCWKNSLRPVPTREFVLLSR